MYSDSEKNISDVRDSDHEDVNFVNIFFKGN